jgi:hypothetical protein
MHGHSICSNTSLIPCAKNKPLRYNFGLLHLNPFLRYTVLGGHGNEAEQKQRE